MIEFAKGCVKTIIEKLNLYVLLQIVWLVEFYVLALFAGKTCLENVFKISFDLPDTIAKYIDKMLVFMTEYNQYIFLFAIMMLLAGLSGWCFTGIGVLKKYKLIYRYSDFGLYAGAWMLFIYYTYRIYINLNAWFLMVPFVALFICAVAKEIREKLESKVIEFSR